MTSSIATDPPIYFEAFLSGFGLVTIAIAIVIITFWMPWPLKARTALLLAGSGLVCAAKGASGFYGVAMNVETIRAGEVGMGLFSIGCAIVVFSTFGYLGTVDRRNKAAGACE